MRSWLQRLRPKAGALRKLGLLSVLVGVGIAAFCWGRRGVAPEVEATPPSRVPLATSAQPISNPAPAAAGDYSRRVVAYLYGNVAITREELGEYLIARFGAERLAFLADRKIAEMECARAGVTVSDIEVEAQLKEDLKTSNLNEADFAKLLRQKGNKSMYEWREDVIRPKLMLAKLLRPKVDATPEDVQKAFDARYGAKVQCRMIVLPHDTIQGGERQAIKIWEEAHASREAFLSKASNQAIPALAAKAGEVPPIHMHFGDTKIEETAFRLKEGEISSLIQLSDGSHVILLCEKQLAKDPERRIENERQKLYAEMKEVKLAQSIPVEFQQMRQRAQPNLVLTREAAQMASNVPAIPAPPPAEIPPPPAPDRVRVPSAN